MMLYVHVTCPFIVDRMVSVVVLRTWSITSQGFVINLYCIYLQVSFGYSLAQSLGLYQEWESFSTVATCQKQKVTRTFQVHILICICIYSLLCTYMCFASKGKLKGILFCFGIGFAGQILHADRRRFKYNFKQEFKSRSIKPKEALQWDIL